MHIDALVVQSFPMNDFSDNVAYGGFGIEDGRLVEYETPKPPWRAWLSSAVADSWLSDLYIVRLVANVALAGDGPAPYDSPTSFDLERALLTEIIAAARQHQIPIVVLVIPTKLVQHVQHGQHPLGPLQAAELQRFAGVRALLQDSGVPYVDAGEIIPDLAADAAKADGAHFSAEGNAAVGEAIAQKLKRMLRVAASHASDR
jgi:lysophospholipase L1-like esterase